jgi:outer membrane lipoprotein-sorting protein
MSTDAPDTSTPRRRGLAWLAPVAGLAVVAVAVTVPMVASASPSLPERTAAQLLADVAGVAGTPLSGTVVETARRGLPALPEAGGTAITPTSLLAGSHTARVWYDGGSKARVALVGDLAETDLVRNGRDAWLWTSGKNTAQHIVLPAGHEAATTSESVTPQQAAQQALAAVDPTTKVTVDGTASVAGRSVYELVLAPRDSRSLVADVRIAVDSKTHVPLRVQIRAAGHTGRPAFETTFTSVTFAKPSAKVFTFAPPPGAKVSGPPVSPPSARKDDKKLAGTPGKEPTVIGSGWTAVAEFAGVSLPGAAAGGDRSDGASGAEQLGALRQAMTPVSGAYGSGQLLRTALVSVLLLDDGRLLVGAVTPATLEQAAAK